jgi:hypothetical protein
MRDQGPEFALQEEDRQKLTRDTIALVLQRGMIEIIAKNLVHLREGIIEGTRDLDLLLESIVEIILEADQELPQENTKNPPKKSTLTFKSAKRFLMKTKGRFFGMVFNGSPKLRLRLRMSYMRAKRESNQK